MAMKCKTCDCNDAEVLDMDAQDLKGSLLKTVCRPCRRKRIERDLAAVIRSHDAAERSHRG